MPPVIDVEKTFNSVVESCGGRLVSELVGNSPTFRNADYIFHETMVIAELKCLREDKSDDPSIKNRLRRLWIKWRQAGLVNGPVPPRIHSRTIPKSCQNEMIRIMGKSIKRRIEKANKQIRETKSALGLPGYKGLLILANDGNLIFEMPAMMHLIYLSIKNAFSEIESVIFFTANMYSWVEGVERPVLFWVHLKRDDAGDFGYALADRLSVEWMKRHNKIIGQDVQFTEIPEMDFFSKKMRSVVF